MKYLSLALLLIAFNTSSAEVCFYIGEELICGEEITTDDTCVWTPELGTLCY